MSEQTPVVNTSTTTQGAGDKLIEFRQYEDDDLTIYTDDGSVILEPFETFELGRLLQKVAEYGNAEIEGTYPLGSGDHHTDHSLTVQAKGPIVLESEVTSVHIYPPNVGWAISTLLNWGLATQYKPRNDHDTTSECMDDALYEREPLYRNQDAKVLIDGLRCPGCGRSYEAVYELTKLHDADFNTVKTY